MNRLMSLLKIGVLFIFLLQNVIVAADQRLPTIGSLSVYPQAITLNYLVNKDWVLGLQDGSYWNVYPLKEKPQQTWYEWWYNITPPEWELEDDFFFDPKAWDTTQEILVYKGDKRAPTGYSYILKNVQTGQKAFAAYIPSGMRLLPKLEFATLFLENPVGEAIKIGSNHSFVSQALILEDNSIWQAVPTSSQSRTLGQWWSNIEVDQPDPSFLVSLSSWQEGDTIQIYCYEGENSAVNALYDPTSKSVTQYLLENKSRGQFAYAARLTAIEFANLYHTYSKKQWNDGYSSGYRSGYNSGRWSNR